MIVDDAAKPDPFSEDDYLRGSQARSIICVPLIKQGRLTGLLYLQNRLSSHALTPDRIAILNLLAAQAAISLENTRLYSDLQERGSKGPTPGRFHFEGRIIEANDAFLQKPRARASQRGDLRPRPRPGRRLRARFDRAQTRGGGSARERAAIPRSADGARARPSRHPDAALRWLGAEPPDLEEVRQALGRIVQNGSRAGDVIGRIRAFVSKPPPCKDSLEINEVILEVIALTSSEAETNGISVRTQLADGLPPIQGDRVQLQQVILNFIINAVDAMSGVGDGARALLIDAGKAKSDGVFVAVRDPGPGLAPASPERVFEAFYTTKPQGLGMGDGPGKPSGQKCAVAHASTPIRQRGSEAT